MASSAETIAAGVVANVPTTCGSLTGIAAKPRKEQKLLDGDSEALPLILVTVRRDGERERLWAGKDLVRYVVTATLYTTKGNLAAQDNAALGWQAAAEAVLNAPSTYGDVNEVWPHSEPPFDPGALKATINKTTAAAQVEVLEDRTY